MGVLNEKRCKTQLERRQRDVAEMRAMFAEQSGAAERRSN